MTAGEVCNRQVVFTRPDTSIVDAVGLMKAHHVGDVVVVREPDGELSEELTDLAKLVAKEQKREREVAR